MLADGMNGIGKIQTLSSKRTVCANLSGKPWQDIRAPDIGEISDADFVKPFLDFEFSFLVLVRMNSITVNDHFIINPQSTSIV